MKVGMIGLGKLGLPVSVALGHKGHQVIGYDKSSKIAGYISRPETYPFIEAGIDNKSFAEALTQHPPTLVDSMADVALAADVIFISVQTPHNEEYSGVTRIPADRRDFDYAYLIAAVRELSQHIESRHTIAIISTCMPGTIRREILPLLQNTPDASTGSRCKIAYNPFFIAMGTVIPDFLNPEFILLGINDSAYPIDLIKVYKQVHGSRVHDAEFMRRMSYESAELAKVAYNTFIGFKIALANTFGMLCDRIENADCDDVMDSLKMAKDRLISEAYLTPGMGDGGACHPRDLIAMSWLQAKHYSMINPFDDVMRWREQHAEYLAYRIIAECGGLPVAIYGLAFKKNTAMLEGSHALLLANILKQSGSNPALYDPIARVGEPVTRPHCIFIGVEHSIFSHTEFPPGSVVIDPFRYLNPPGVKVIHIGRGGYGSRQDGQPLPEKRSPYELHRGSVHAE